MMRSMPKHHGPLVESRALKSPAAPKVKLLKLATVSFAAVHSPMVEMSPTKEKMSTSAKYTVCIR